MTITEIIDGLEEIQNGESIISDMDIPRVCELSKHLALHVQKLEIDMRNINVLFKPL
jgi:hypothetical protein